jgi:hypothetical protein
VQEYTSEQLASRQLQASSPPPPVRPTFPADVATRGPQVNSMDDMDDIQRGGE